MATASPWQHPLGAQADIVIVGGGIIGAATAFWLRRLAPERSVLLLEARHLAYGASGRNAGFLLLGTHSDYASAVDTYGRDRAQRIWQFTRETYRHILDDVDTGQIGLETKGSVIAAGTAEEADRLRRSQQLLAEDGVESRWIEPAEVEARTGLRGMHGALVVPDGGAIHPVQLVRQLVAESGALVREGIAVRDIESAGDGVQIGIRAGGSLVANQVLLAPGPRLPKLVPALADAVRPIRAQMLATGPLPPRLPRPVYSHEGYFYLRQRDDGRLFLGGARHLHRADEVGFVDATTKALQADLERYLHQHIPSTRGAAIERRWSGTMGFSPNGLPSLGDVPDVPNALYATGFTGHGMGYGVRFGLLAARRLLGQADEADDLFGDATNLNPAAQPDVL
ncbi:MAG: FAD-binding oxidoreductase [Rubricoccaceae bacterium]